MEMAIVEKLNEHESRELARLETIIERGLKSFIAVGEALLTINEKRLYRESYGTFADYCNAKWKMSDKHAYHLMAGVEVRRDLEKAGYAPDLLPTNEYQARELARLDADRRAAAWGEAIRSNDGRIPTGAQVIAVVRRLAVRGKPTANPGKPQETFADIVRHQKPDGRLRYRTHENRALKIKNQADRLAVLAEYGDWDGYLRALVEIAAAARDIAIAEDLVTTE